MLKTVKVLVEMNEMKINEITVSRAFNVLTFVGEACGNFKSLFDAINVSKTNSDCGKLQSFRTFLLRLEQISLKTL